MAGKKYLEYFLVEVFRMSNNRHFRDALLIICQPNCSKREVINSASSQGHLLNETILRMSVENQRKLCSDKATQGMHIINIILEI